MSDGVLLAYVIILLVMVVVQVSIDISERTKRRRFCRLRDKLLKIVVDDCKRTEGLAFGILLPKYKGVMDYDAENDQECIIFREIVDDGRERIISITVDGKHITKSLWIKGGWSEDGR